MSLVFVTLSKNKEEGSNDCVQKNMERKNVYTYRLKKIRKVCKKYGLSASDEGKIPITKSKIIQSEFAYHTIPPFNDKVYCKITKLCISNAYDSRLSSCILTNTLCSIAGFTKRPRLHGAEYFLRRAT